MSRVERVRVDLAERSYDILIGQGLLNEAGKRLARVLDEREAVVVTDETVARLHLSTLEGSLADAGLSTRTVVIPPGEPTKDFAHLEDLVERLLEEGMERRTVLLALGGGVIGDLVGFAASILLRGVDFVQVPTTLLAQVDSAVGGKTGINTRHGKNLVGSFHQPRLVLADTATLATLSRRERLAGYAEVVKYALIRDAGFFTWLEGKGGRVVDGGGSVLLHAIKKCCQAKAAIVAADEREAGARQLLNLGHTFGHALETAVEYGEEVRHGEAVSVGIALAFDLSVRLGLCPAAHAARVKRHLSAVGLPVGLHRIARRRLHPEDLLRHMTRDKKVREGKMTFVLVHGIGKAFLSRDVDHGVVVAFLEGAIAA